MIFFAIIITSVYDRFAEGASPVLISLLLISCKYSIWNLLFFQGEALSQFFRLHRVVFVWTARPHRGAIAAFQPPPPPPAPPTKKKKKKDKCSIDKCSGEMGMVDIDWAIKERLRQKKSRDSRGTVDMGHFLSREVRVEIDRQCWTDLNSISGVRI